MLPTGYRIRPASAADAAIVAHHRVAMFRDMGAIDGAAEAPLERASLVSLGEALATGTYYGWLIEAEAAVVGGGGLVLRPLLPRPGHLEGGTEAYVLNVYTEPAHRRAGLARALMDAVLAWCAERGITRVTLHASDAGRPLYETLGFAATNEMRRGA